MKQAELNRAVARATGDTVHTIKRLGFLLVDPNQTLATELPDDGPYVLDWDTMEPQRLKRNAGRSSCEPVNA